ncbi:hypothetical protein, partial [Bacillus velezensis]|uniref:hypothetical protein n=1 Tax=Bacillus velezensis TaxID=492670 RepID=UPI001CB9163B
LLHMFSSFLPPGFDLFICFPAFGTAKHITLSSKYRESDIFLFFFMRNGKMEFGYFLRRGRCLA